MSREHYTSFGKILILILFSIILFNSLPAHGSNKKVLLLPLALYAEKPLDHIRKGAAGMLITRLSQGGLEVMSGEGIEAYLDEEEKKGISSEKRAQELISKLGADYAVFGSITAVGSTYSLDLSLLGSKEGLPPARFSKVVAEDQFIPEFSNVANQVRAVIEGREIQAPKPGEKAAALPEPRTTKGIFSKVEEEEQAPGTPQKGLSFKPTSEYQELKPTYTIPVSMEVMAFDSGDLDGDGMVELAVLGRESFVIYQRHGERFVLKDTLKPSFGEKFLKVSVGDGDGNGKAEIYVVGLSGLRARTTVVEWAGDFHRLYRTTGHLQAIRNPAGGNPLLLFQNSTAANFFSGDIYAMGYGSGEALTRTDQLPTLRGVQFYTLTRYDLDGDGNHEWMGLRDDERLYVWDQNGRVLWKANETIGGTNNALHIGEVRSPGGDPPRVPLNSRLLIADIDGDANNEILVTKNIPIVRHMEGLKIYTKSHLVVFRVEGAGLAPAWTTRQIDYCLVDIQAQGPALLLAAQKPKLTAFGEGSGLIMWFE